MSTEDRRLSKVQLKVIYDLVVKSGLDPGEFQKIEIKNGPQNRFLSHEFRHPPTEAFFRFGWNAIYATDGFDLRWWPTAAGTGQHKFTSLWPEVLGLFELWTKVVALEIATPDVWAIAREQRAWITSSEKDFKGNAPFTAEEQEVISRHLRAIEAYAVKTFNLQQADADYVRQQIDYLVDRSKKFGRFDWKNLAYAAFINMATGLALEPKKASALVAFASQLLGHLVSGAGHLVSQATNLIS